MSVYSEYLDHVGASHSQQPKAGRVTSTHKSTSYLKTGLLIRSVICLAFVAVGAVYSLV
jgi:hypothetical protein